MFYYHNDVLTLDEHSLVKVAEDFGTPTFVYSLEVIREQAAPFIAWMQRQRSEQQRIQVCYAVKANSNLAILQLMHRFGFGFDIVSLGEMRRVIEISGNMTHCVFSGVGKTDEEIRQALLYQVGSLNVETMSEFERINRIASELGVLASVMIRINPNIPVETHPYITTALENSKFGIAFNLLPQAVKLCQSLKHIQLIGISCHLGSQIQEMAPFLQALELLISLLKKLHDEEGISLKKIDMGGGFSVPYIESETPFPIEAWMKKVDEQLMDPHPVVKNLTLVVEPGRYLVANSGALLAKVIATKNAGDKNYLIIDAAMNDLIRPALYGACHRVQAVSLLSNAMEKECVVVGPICESADILNSGVSLKARAGDLVAVMDVGAYAVSMGSNYNSRRRASEVLIDGNQAHLIREREDFHDLWAKERKLKE